MAKPSEQRSEFAICAEQLRQAAGRLDFLALELSRVGTKDGITYANFSRTLAEVASTVRLAAARLGKL